MAATEPWPVMQQPDGPHPSRRRGLAVDFGYMASSVILDRVLGLVYLILVRRLLSPSAIGVSNIIDTAVVWLSAVTVGVGFSSERLIPLYRGQGRLDLEGRVKAFLFNWTMVEGLIVASAVAGYAVVFGGRHSDDVRIGLYWLPVLLLAQKLLSVYLTIFRSAKEFPSYSVARVLFSALDWATIPFVIWFGLPGLFASMAAVAVLKVAYFHLAMRHYRLDTLGLYVGRVDLGQHLPYGPQYALFKLVFTLSQRVDAMLVGFLVGTQALAFYYLGNQIAAVVIEVPLTLAYISFPNVMERFSGARENQAFLHELDRYIRVQLYAVLPVLMPAAYFGSEFIVRNFLPEYQPGMWAVKLAIVALGFSAVRHFYYQVLFANKRINILTFLSVIQLGFLFSAYLLLSMVVVNPLIAVAIAALLGQAGHFLLVLVAARKVVGPQTSAAGRVWAADFLACAALGGVLLLVDLLVPVTLHGNLVAAFFNGALLAAVCTVVILPMSYVGLGRHRAALARLAGGQLRRVKVWQG